MSNEDRFSQVESAARRLIEGFFDRISGDRLNGSDLAVHLARSFETLVDAGKAKHTNYYEIHLHPDDVEHIVDHEPDTAKRLSDWLPELATEVGIGLASPPLVELIPDPIIRFGRVMIRSEIDPDRQDSKTRMNSRKAVETEMLKVATQREAWLIINGKQHVNLDELVMHIGRRPDNEIVIESQTISRVHAQIRWRFNHFNLFDLGSRAGVFVNGERIDECVLQPGDVIQLAEVSIIYGEGSDSDEEEKESPETQEQTQTRWRRR